MLNRAEQFARDTQEGFAQMFSDEGQATALDHLGEKQAVKPCSVRVLVCSLSQWRASAS